MSYRHQQADCVSFGQNTVSPVSSLYAKLNRPAASSIVVSIFISNSSQESQSAYFPECLLQGKSHLSSRCLARSLVARLKMQSPSRAFNLLNSLNSPQMACGQNGRRKKSRVVSFLPSHCCLSLPLFLSSSLPTSAVCLFSWLASLQGLFAFYLLMRCIPSFLKRSISQPRWVLLTNGMIYMKTEHRAVLLWRCLISPRAPDEAHIHTRILCCITTLACLSATGSAR